MAAKIHSQREIYQVIEQRLRESPKPLTVSELLDLPDVRATAMAGNPPLPQPRAVAAV